MYSRGDGKEARSLCSMCVGRMSGGLDWVYLRST